ncbi:beta-lactamase family protein [Penicillium verhagenii]|uniref:beta-lactamase family protein n=1 Tax=Penicillium verhagenii TaxID=1562060 RepID=UPI0025453689|nr:beta-lactamase family protein [Penicillium verhagenii]KAJ5935518.1 beta-lactamase family protein [Penicillium verhagenii]
MLALKAVFTFILVLALSHRAYSSCEPEISYPAPIYNLNTLKSTFQEIDNSLNKLIKAGDYSGSSFSLEISSPSQTLYTKYHFDKSLGGSPINGSSRYRIASNTKLFTALGILKQEAAGKLGLDDEVTKYIPGLLDGTSKISWKGITLRSLLAHLSGLPDNYGDEDLLLMLSDPSAIGLPPLDTAEKNNLPKCGAYTGWTVACTDADLDENLHNVNPVFPSQKETSYSNVGFDLLGQVLANVTNMKYEDYIEEAIFKPLGMQETSFTVPVALVAASAGSGSDWGVDEGTDNPSAGIYSSSSDMIKFLRWVLKNYDKITPSLNWFQPAAWNSGSHSLLGYPWEIFRTTSILPDTKRPVTFYTKGGGLTDYYTYSFIIPQYNLVVFMGVAGGLSALNTIFTDVLNPLIVAAESEAQSQLESSYGGIYSSTDSNLNSSITLTQTQSRSLYISSWISNSTDVLANLIPFVSSTAGTSGDMYFQLLPTFKTRRTHDGQVGEVWRLIDVIDDYDGSTNSTTVWNDYCVVNIDPFSYGTVPLNELVLWRNSSERHATVESVTLLAFKVNLWRN